MQRFVLLHRDYFDVEKVWHAYNVALELHEYWSRSLRVKVDSRAGDSNLFLSRRVSQIPRLGESVISPLDLVRDFPGPDGINISMFFPTVDYSWHYGLYRQLFYRIISRSQPYWVDECFLGLNCSLSVIHLSKLLRINIEGRLKFV